MTALTTLLPLTLATSAFAPPQDPVALPATPPASTTLWWGDFDDDGRLDAYAAQPDGVGRLLLNLGEGEFDDVTDRAGLSAGLGAHMAAWGDANGDGLLDLFLPVWRGRSALYFQAVDGTFVDGTDASGLPPFAAPLDAAWRDLDADGDLDLHLVTEFDDLVYHNDGRGRFERAELGLASRALVVAPTSPDSNAAPGEAPIGASGGGASTAGNGPTFDIACALGLWDQADPGACLSASSAATLGMLYPLSTNLFVDEATGRVGIGTTNPGFPLEVMGAIRTTGDVRANRGVFGADPPLAVAGSSLVAKLNADMLDGLHASAFATLPVTGGDIANGTITDVDIASGAAIHGTKVTPDFGAQTLLTDGIAGVGTSFPNSQLHVNGPPGSDPLRVQVSGSTRFFVEDTGNVAVGGFFDPVTPLHVAGHAFAQNSEPGGRGFEGYASATGSSSQYGVAGFTAGTGSTSAAVFGGAFASSGGARGVWGSSSSANGIGVYGIAAGGSSTNFGVFGRSSSTSGRGVRGEANATSGLNYGVQGRTFSPSGYGIISFGASGSTGQKSFIQPHPTDATKEIRFISLEGNESGTYFRGKTRIVGGRAVIEVPEEFRLVSTADDITVQTTGVGAPAAIWVESYDLDEIVVRASVDIELHYVVNSVRRGFTQPRIVAENSAYVPEVRGREAFTELPDDLRRILVANGILNADFTPNEATAAQMGWTLLSPEEADAQRASGPEPTPVSPLLIEK